MDPTHRSKIRTTARKAEIGKRARVTQEVARLLQAGRWGGVMQPPDHQSEWRGLDLDANALAYLTPAELLDVLLDISPDVGRAAWDYCRMFNPGHSIVAYRPGAGDEEHRQDHPQAQAALDAFIDRLRARRHGGLAAILSQLAMSAFMRGAMFTELVHDGRQAIDIAVPDPATVRFRLSADDHGDYWELGQQTARNQFESLQEYDTVWYVPIDPKPGAPYGRSIAAPGLIPALFSLVLLHDVRRIVANQGAPRTDVTYDVDMIREAYPEASGDELTSLLDEIANDATETIEGLEPDDAYLHPTWIAVKWAEGALSGANLQGFNSLTEALEKMLVRGLKTMPLVMGVTEGMSEANANRQWELYVQSIKELQKAAAEMLGLLFKRALEVEGIQADVVVEFDTLRASEGLRDEQVQQMKISNARELESLGYLTRDEASEYAVGHPAHGEKFVLPELRPREEDDEDDTPLDGEEAPDEDTASDERMRLAEQRMRRAVIRAIREKFDPGGFSAPEVPDIDAITEGDLVRAAARYARQYPDEAGLLHAEPV